MVMSTERKALNQPPQPHQPHQLKQGSEPRVLIFFGSASSAFEVACHLVRDSYGLQRGIGCFAGMSARVAEGEYSGEYMI